MHAYNFHITPYDLVLLGTLFVAGTFILLLGFGASINRAANRVLALVLVSVILHLFWALGPLIYLYSLKITRPEYKFRRKDLWLFCPLLLGTYSVIIYLYLSHRLIEQFYQRQKFEGLERHHHELRWLDRQLLGFGVLWLLWIAGMDLLLGVMTVCLASVAFLRKEEEPFVREGSDKIWQKGIWLKKRVKENLYYQDPELTLHSLAEKLGMHPHELSRIINTVFKKNFPDFVNELRVAEVIRKMKDKNNDRMTILGIALDAGFNSKTSFNRTFKQMTGKTPAEYKKDRPYHKMEPQRQFPVVISYMFKNNLKFAWRNLLRGKTYSVINIIGLATGMAAALVIGIWITGEVAVDKSYPDRSRIVEIMQDQRPNGTPPGSPITYRGMTVSSALEPYLKKTYKDIFAETAMFEWPGDGLLTSGDKSISRQGSWAEHSFPTIFGYQFLSGNAESMLDPNTALISRSTAIALYGTEKALGKSFKYNNQLMFTVGGVYADLPETSSFHGIDFFTPITHQWMDWLTHNTNFNNHSCRIFARLAGNTTVEGATARIKDICTPFVKYNIETYTVLPFDQLYLHYDFDSVAGSGRIGQVRLIGIIGVFVLLLACINFMNLSTARSEKRAMEVGIRKTLGSLRTQLISQFLGESLLVAFFGFVLAIGLAVLSLPAFSLLCGKPMSLPLTSPIFWALSLAITGTAGLLAGSYPAFYLSGFRPVKVLKGAFKSGKGAGLPRKILVVAQFSISLSLVIGTLVVFRQIQYAQDRPVGYDRAGLINIPINSDLLDRHYEALRTSLLGTGVVAGVANSSTLMTAFYQNNFMEWPGMTGEQKNISFRDIYVNSDFGPTISWTVLRGRDFSRAFGTDSSSAIVNEEGARALGFKNPIGKTFRLNNTDWTIIGVTKDMISNSPYDKVQPAVFLGSGGHSVDIIRIKPGTPIRTALTAIEAVYKEYNPSSPFIYHFNDDDYAQKFVTETRIGNLATVFSGLAILISCLGLFGLASFVAEQRTKEIGVRKVLGARIVDLWALLSGDFLKLIACSMVIAMPLIALAMNKWLQNYPMHTHLSPWIFVLSGAGMLFITLFTVSFQALKAALMNPVKSLRTE